MSDARKIWETGYGEIRHSDETVRRVEKMVGELEREGMKGDGVDPYELLVAADRVASAAMWLVVQSSYVKNVYLDGRDLSSDDFKKAPEGHTGGSLNMVPAYVGYMLADALTGITRGWVMSQGHCVAAIDSVNLLLGNLMPEHSSRYHLSDEGLSRFTQDFYSYRLNDQGKQDSPRGSHVNHNTGGGIMEGGYLGFTSVQYSHMPLPGERLVAFLSDGAFDEQRGDDWVPLWWRSEDCGLVTPIMIANGRRIDQRSTMFQQGGMPWFTEYLKLQHFDPVVIDGRDPAAFAWAIFESERELSRRGSEGVGESRYPVRMPYAVAVAPKGAGFYNEGTNAAHDLPIDVSPHDDEVMRDIFNHHTKKLWVPLEDLHKAIGLMTRHEGSFRPKEKDNPLANRDVALEVVPDLQPRPIPVNRMDQGLWTTSAPMSAFDDGFAAIVTSNTHLRPRVGNPDELRSNRMVTTLETLKFRVTNVEAGNEESVFGNVVTALNEEAVAGAAYGNKGGINIIVTYEAFGMKMAGELRQEIIFAKHLKDAGRAPKWLSIPLVVASHTWENGKNEQSHQDPSLAEVMLGETSDVSRVVFPADYNSSLEVVTHIYQTHGQLWTVVASKRVFPDLFTKDEARQMVLDGGMRLTWAEHKPDEAKLSFVAIGSYQLREILLAAMRLKDRDIPYTVSYIMEPGRFRFPRNDGERAHLAPESVRQSIVPPHSENVIVSAHSRPEPVVGAIQPVWDGKRVRGFGFINEGGTLDADGLIWVNKLSWLHLLRESARMLSIPEDRILSEDERAALDGHRNPVGIVR
jgi:phosphoketolase